MRFVSPYEDDGGLGTMTTASLGVYDTQGLLIGVAGADFLMSDLKKHADADVVLNSLISSSNVCRNVTLPPCQIQLLRQTSSVDAVCGTSAEEGNNVALTSAECDDPDSVVLTACSNEAASAICPIGSKERKFKYLRCCEDEEGSPIVLIIVLVVVVVVVIVAFVILKKVFCKPKPPPQYPGQNKPQIISSTQAQHPQPQVQQPMQIVQQPVMVAQPQPMVVQQPVQQPAPPTYV